ncbi:hypothetical protein QOT17_004181 [Balamuthia mandrillaris]
MEVEALPDELVAHVLSFLGPYDLCHAAGMLCKRFHSISQSEFLWKGLCSSFRFNAFDPPTTSACSSSSFKTSFVSSWKSLYGNWRLQKGRRREDLLELQGPKLCSMAVSSSRIAIFLASLDAVHVFDRGRGPPTATLQCSSSSSEGFFYGVERLTLTDNFVVAILCLDESPATQHDVVVFSADSGRELFSLSAAMILPANPTSVWAKEDEHNHNELTVLVLFGCGQAVEWQPSTGVCVMYPINNILFAHQQEEDKEKEQDKDDRQDESAAIRWHGLYFSDKRLLGCRKTDGSIFVFNRETNHYHTIHPDIKFDPSSPFADFSYDEHTDRLLLLQRNSKATLWDTSGHQRARNGPIAVLPAAGWERCFLERGEVFIGRYSALDIWDFQERAAQATSRN